MSSGSEKSPLNKNLTGAGSATPAMVRGTAAAFRRLNIRAIVRDEFFGASSPPATNYTLTALGGAYTVTGSSAVILRSKLLTASGGNYALTGSSAVLGRNRKLTASGGAYTYTGQQATITYTPGAINYTLTALGGSYSLAGQTATILRNRALSAQGGAYAYTGGNAVIERDRRLTANGGAYSLLGADATITKSGVSTNYTLTALGGEYSLSGGQAAITKTASRRQAGGRRSYIIKEKRYWLDERELAIVVSQMLEEIKRKDIKLDDPVKPQNISRRSWAEVKRTLQAIEAMMIPEAQPIIQQIADDFDEDEELLLMLL